MAIARALMMEPQVLLFDEPTAALDPEITAQIVTIIRELAQTQITQVIVTHEVEVARKTASRVVRQNVGMVFQQYNLWPHLTVMQNLTEAPCRVLGLTKEAARARADKLLERLRLTPYADRFPLHLSGGHHQALSDINLECPQGETLVLLGPSGAGKSSLLRVLNLLELPRSGTLQIAGNQFDFTKTPADSAIRERKVAQTTPDAGRTIFCCTGAGNALFNKF
ncbi:hypothetical protein CRX72_13080 [Pantoea sp. BRM17]|nr:hypothetical protein CRX72_13080 [Pantoea sp. BRM17]